MKRTIIIKLMLFSLVTGLYGANISTTTGLDQNTPWISVLQQLDNGNIKLTLSGLTLGSSPTLTLPLISGGLTASGSVANDFSGSTGAFKLSTGHVTLEGVTSTGATGTGKFVFDGTPTLVTPVIGAATGTSVALTGKITTTSASTGIGYATGAGGAVTQITNRSTGVTMVPNPCTSGTITTTTSSLAAEAAAAFIVTDSAVAIGDVVVVSIQSGSNGGNTAVTVSTVTNGTFTILVSNNNAAAGTAETGAILINFAIIKAVSS